MSNFIKFAKFWELQGKDSGVCFEAKLKGFRQSFREATWGCFQAKLKGLQTRLQGRGFGLLSCQAEGLQTRLQTGLQGRLLFLRRGSGYAFKSSQRRLQGKNLEGGALKPSETRLLRRDPGGCFEAK